MKAGSIDDYEQERKGLQHIRRLTLKVQGHTLLSEPLRVGSKCSRSSASFDRSPKNRN
jgi:hypothetical protein